MRIVPNPYRWDQVNLKLFYGRQQLARDIIADLNNSHSSAIVGGRKMGKTTLLRKIENDLAAAMALSLPAGLLSLPIYVDILKLPHPLTAKSIYIDVVRQVESYLKLNGLLGKSYTSKAFVFEEFPREESRAFTQILLNFIETVEMHCFLQIAVLIDEIEPVVKTEWAEGFFSNWRHLLSNEPELSSHISAIFSGAKEMAAIAQDIGSPLANILTWRELSLFSRKDTERLVNEPTDGVLPASIAGRVFNHTGGHPFLIQYVMNYICKFDTGEAEGKLKEAQQQFLTNQGAQFHSWWFEKFSDEDRQVYAYLADQRKATPKRNVILLVGDIVANRSLAVLCHTGVVRKVGKLERYEVAGSTFKSWFRKYGNLVTVPSACDTNIYENLSQLDPEIASKYVSAWSIHNAEHPNYSGAVSEMRDVITLVLHKLAPDEKIMSQTDYIPEKDESGKPLKKPTRKQRTKYILERKGNRDISAINKEINYLETIVEQLASVVTGGYAHASARTHTVATRDQAWKCLKQLDSILAQLL